MLIASIANPSVVCRDAADTRRRAAADEHRQALGRERQRRLRARRRGRDYKASYWIAADGRVLSLLVQLGWLAEDKAADAREVGQAISALLADAARH